MTLVLYAYLSYIWREFDNHCLLKLLIAWKWLKIDLVLFDMAEHWLCECDWWHLILTSHFLALEVIERRFCLLRCGTDGKVEACGDESSGARGKMDFPEFSTNSIFPFNQMDLLEISEL